MPEKHPPHPSATDIANGAHTDPIRKETKKDSGKEAKKNTEEDDVVIIGAGPVGLFAVFQCGQLGLRCHVVDALDHIGGQCGALYPEKPIYDIPAWPEISGAGLVRKLRAQIDPYRPKISLGQSVEKMERDGDAIVITRSNGSSIRAKAAIIAAGSGAFAPNRPPLDGIHQFEGHSVFYAVKRRDDFAGKTIVIAGGGDSALDWTIDLAPIAKKIFLVHRRAKFRGVPASIEKVERLIHDKKVETVIPYHLDGLEGEKGHIHTVGVKTLNGEKRRLTADILLAFFGLSSHLGPICDWNIDMRDDRIQVDPSRCATSLEGVFAIGDVVHYPGKLKLILSGFAEAAQAAHAIFPIARPGKFLRFQYSTAKGKPKSE